MRLYAPYITVPAAAIVGVIGYNLENILSDKYTPYKKESIDEARTNRLLAEQKDFTDPNVYERLKDKKFVPKSVFDRNLSPGLSEKTQWCKIIDILNVRCTVGYESNLGTLLAVQLWKRIKRNFIIVTAWLSVFQVSAYKLVQKSWI